MVPTEALAKLTKRLKTNKKPTDVAFFSEKDGTVHTLFPDYDVPRIFHAASVGKLFTAVLIFRLAERGLLHVDTPVDKLLEHRRLENLFVRDGADYSGRVTVRHLLAHTSGVADYFAGPVLKGRRMVDLLIAEPDRAWTPIELLDFSRRNQKAVAVPGERFYYSDTGYVLLGFIIEKLMGIPFGKALEKEFFEPLNMKDTFLLFENGVRNRPEVRLEKAYLRNTEMSSYTSASSDWAGGGVASTTKDLLRFSRALREGKLIGEASLALMDACERKFRIGIRYGLGMMELRFGEFFFLLNTFPRLKGHIGILATHLWYDPVHRLHIAMNFGSDSRMVESFRFLGRLLPALGRRRTPSKATKLP